MTTQPQNSSLALLLTPPNPHFFGGGTLSDGVIVRAHCACKRESVCVCVVQLCVCVCVCGVHGMCGVCVWGGGGVVCVCVWCV